MQMSDLTKVIIYIFWFIQQLNTLFQMKIKYCLNSLPLSVTQVPTNVLHTHSVHFIPHNPVPGLTSSDRAVTPPAGFSVVL